VEFREEENYYFRLAEHKQWLLDLIDRRDAAGDPLVVPEFRVSELRNALERLAGDLCISRPKARLDWGIPFPFDDAFVTYVWFDALVNYISFAPGYDPSANASLAEFRRWWPALHVIGKDILIPAHGVYWPIMLKALGFGDDEIPRFLVHGWWNIGGEKMSKSVGNVVDPDQLADTYGVEALRYYLMSDISTGKDADFSRERLVLRYNTDLANSFGNLLNRQLNMARKYRSGKLSKFQHPGSVNLESLANSYVAAYSDRMEGRLTLSDGSVERTDPYQIHSALASVFDLVNHCNQLVDSEKPWVLAKNEADATRLDAVLYHLADCLRIIAILISPILPDAARRIAQQLGIAPEFRLAEAKWGGLPDGHPLGEPSPLFPRLETSKD
jgi:methionyl-tRNA synthetase